MGRILGLDYGTVRIGVALSDPVGMLAKPLPFIPATPWREAVAQLQTLCETEKVTDVVVGLPINMDGTEGDSVKGARRLGERVAEQTGLPVTYIDERLTSAAAERIMLEDDTSRRKRKQKVDSLAASILLQNYLDRNMSGL